VSLNVTKADAPAARFEEISGSLNRVLAEEDFWIKHVRELLTTILDKGQTITWASFHAQKQLPRLDPAAIVALLPLFFE